MGHQSSFYLTKTDTKNLEAQLRKRFDFVVFRYRSKSAKPHLVDSLYIEEDGDHKVDAFIARPEDLDAVIMDYVPTQRYWTAETDPSPLLEFRASSFKDNVFRCGRVYYVDHFVGPEGTWVKKSEDFRKWASSVHRAVKKALMVVKPFPGVTEYAGEEAAALLASGTVKISQR